MINAGAPSAVVEGRKECGGTSIPVSSSSSYVVQRASGCELVGTDYAHREFQRSFMLKPYDTVSDSRLRRKK
jgi:hypothetical protein